MRHLGPQWGILKIAAMVRNVNDHRASAGVIGCHAHLSQVGVVRAASRITGAPAKFSHRGGRKSGRGRLLSPTAGKGSASRRSIAACQERDGPAQRHRVALNGSAARDDEIHQVLRRQLRGYPLPSIRAADLAHKAPRLGLARGLSSHVFGARAGAWHHPR